MSFLGSLYGVRYHFENMILTGIEVPMHRKAHRVLREEFSGPNSLCPGPLGAPHPIYHPYRGPSGEEFVLDRGSVQGTSQSLGIGQRRLEVSHYSSKLDGFERSSGMLRGQLSLMFDLREPADWRLVVPDVRAIRRDPPSSLELILVDHLTVALSGSRPLQIVSTGGDACIQMDLPAGTSRIDLQITSRPFFAFAPTIVFCRPDQVREAAVVLSCLPSNRFIPVVPVPPPPTPASEYQQLLQHYRQCEQERNQRSGTRSARWESGQSSQDRQQVRQLQTRCENLLQQMTPFRRWLKERASLATLLADAPWETAVFLFAPQPHDLHIPLSLYYGSEWGDPTSLPLVPDDIPRFCFLRQAQEFPAGWDQAKCFSYPDLSGLTDVAWPALGPSRRAVDRTIETSEGREGLVFAGLYRALREQVPLRLTPSPPGSLEEACQAANDGVAADEAVLVEEGGGAAHLLGVVYAHYRRACLTVCPRPDLAAVEEALAVVWEEQQRQAENAAYLSANRQRGLTLPGLSVEDRERLEALPEVKASRPFVSSFSPPRFLARLRDLFNAWRSSRTKIEAAVTRQVPEFVIREVGQRRLTAFTAGLPYSFVKTGHADWSGKPIGHVLVETPLVILDEIHRQGCASAPVTIGLILDTEPFGPAEANQVLRSLQGRRGHTILLSREHASLRSILTLACVLPVEIVYINTHGSGDQIELGLRASDFLGPAAQGMTVNQQLPNFKLMSWARLPSRPVVLNNSCKSWFGVGREFLERRVTRLRRHALERGQSVLHAIYGGRPAEDRGGRPDRCRSGCERSRGRQHVAGVLGHRHLQHLPGAARCAGPTDEREYRIGLLQLFLERLLTLGADPRNSGPASVLYAEVQGLRSRLEQEAGDGAIVLIDLYLLELHALIVGCGEWAGDHGRLEQLVKRCRDQLALASLPEAAREERSAQLGLFAAQVLSRTGDTVGAIKQLEESIQAAQAQGGFPAEQYFLLSELNKHAGQWQKALDAATQARMLYERENQGAGITGTIGQLGQIQRRLGNFDQAEALAREGLDLASRRRDRREQILFRQDLTLVYLARHQFDRALESAQHGRRLARTYLDDRGELAFLGMLAQAHLRRGELVLAQQAAEMGLALARELREMGQECDFIHDLGFIHLEAGRHEEAQPFLKEATQMLLRLGRTASVATMLGEMMEACKKRESWEAIFVYLAATLYILELLDATCRVGFASGIINGLKEVVRKAPCVVARSGIHQTWRCAHQLIHERSADASPQLQFLANFLAMLEFWFDGKTAQALEGAEFLDRGSENAFRLREFVVVAPPH